MPLLGNGRDGGRITVHRAGPVGTAIAAIAVIPLVLIGLVTLALGLLLLPGARRNVRVWRFGGAPGAGDAPGAADAPPGGTADATPIADGGTPEGNKPREKSFAEIVELWPLALAAALLAAALAPGAAHAKLLVPMDDAQTDHLKAYGLTFWTLEQGAKAEWLLNYRGGSFLLPDGAAYEREANIRGVAIEAVSAGDEAAIRAKIADENMEVVALEKAPKVAVYVPPNSLPWDDAVTLALQYAGIPYDKVWDEEVLRGDLVKYDWLHLHHEDFTGQQDKFWAAFHTMPWYLEAEAAQHAMAAKMGFAKVPALKCAVARTIRDFVTRGGFLFAMCTATDTYDIALAADGVDIADVMYDGDPQDPDANRKLDFSRTLAFRDFHIEPDPMINVFSDIDVTADARKRGPNTLFTLFDFSAKNDPVPAMLTQDHTNAVPEFLGVTTGFHRARLKPGVTVLGEVEGTDEVKYIHGEFGRGTYTFLGGHDPEAYEHRIGDPATKLDEYPHSPGYRLILNNVLFPAAEKKKQKT